MKSKFSTFSLLLVFSASCFFGGDVESIDVSEQNFSSQRAFGAKLRRGVDQHQWIIEMVAPGSPAEQMGLVAGDVLTHISEIDLGNIDVEQVGEIVRAELNKENIVLGIERNGVFFEFKGSLQTELLLPDIYDIPQLSDDRNCESTLEDLTTMSGSDSVSCYRGCSNCGFAFCGKCTCTFSPCDDCCCT
jgi:hypothetical protein